MRFDLLQLVSMCNSTMFSMVDPPVKPTSTTEMSINPEKECRLRIGEILKISEQVRALENEKILLDAYDVPCDGGPLCYQNTMYASLIERIRDIIQTEVPCTVFTKPVVGPYCFTIDDSIVAMIRIKTHFITKADEEKYDNWYIVILKLYGENWNVEIPIYSIANVKGTFVFPESITF